MRQAKTFFILALTLAVALSAAAAKKPPTQPGKYETWGPDIDSIEIVKSFSLSSYSKVIVEPLDGSKTPPPEDADVAEKAAKVLEVATVPFVKGLRDAAPKLEIVDAPAASTAGALLVRGRVTTMDPGSRAKRMWVGYGAGAARTAIEAEIVDAATGEVLVRFVQERRSGIERFGRGSSYEEIMKRNLTALGKDTANLLNQF